MKCLMLARHYAFRFMETKKPRVLSAPATGVKVIFAFFREVLAVVHSVN